ncbi:MAG TPA: hypothetical protein VFR41_07640, partial [Acidimicrobiia bacterium]|nr:hypothetical protein [Acidimicrobiia bacterium]
MAAPRPTVTSVARKAKASRGKTYSPTPTSCGAPVRNLPARVCRVIPDLTAVERAFDYAVPDALAGAVRVGALVRVPLHGRRVRGWVIADDVEPEAAELLDVLSASAGPPADVVVLSEWIASRWAGPRVAVLRSASPPNLVPATVWSNSGARATESAQTKVRVVRQPPLLDRRADVAAMCAAVGSTIVCIADAGRARTFGRYLVEQGRNVALLHSVEPDAARTAAWSRAARGDCIVVGGRVAALAPVSDLAAVVVVDDNDEALQEERSPTWHARDVLIERASRAGALLTICGPAPTVTAVARASEVVAPPVDVERAGWPRVEVVDRRAEPPGAGLLTDALGHALRSARGLAVCIVNRRGRYRVLVCGNCGHVLRWDRSDERPLVCPECGATKLRVIRAGVTRLREELSALVSTARVVDID